ncbi:hypothetical protein ACLK1T_23435 [Escherichia coli]
MWQLITTGIFISQSPSVKRINEVEILLPVMVGSYGNSHNFFYIDDDGYALLSAMGML